MLPLLMFMFLPAVRERQNTQPKGTYFIVSKILVVSLKLFALVKPTFIFLQQTENCHTGQTLSKSFSKLFATTSPRLDKMCHEDISKK